MEDGDGDLNCFASKVQEFLSSFEASKEQCKVDVFKETMILFVTCG
jgi:hypothetical protein